jgi:hypothetical protein
VGNSVNINVPGGSTENLADTLIAGNSAGANQINMNSNKIINCLNPTNPQDVATKGYVDAYSPTADSLASVLAISNIVGATGINLNNTQFIYNAPNPVNATDLANKAYVDSSVPGADPLSVVLGVGNIVGATGINFNNTQKAYNLPAPTDAGDATNKQYVDGRTLGNVMTAGNTASATLNMAGYDIGDAGSITAGGITEAINFGTLITPMLGNNQYATNISINGINPLANAVSIEGVGGLTAGSTLGDVSISCGINKDLNITGGDVNISQIDPGSVMNISSVGAMALVSGIGLDISATATVLINSSGNISIGSGNALGADVEVEKIAFKENVIYKAITLPVPADIEIQDVASIVNVGDPIAINGSITNISAQVDGDVNISTSGTGNVVINATGTGNVAIEGISIDGTTITAPATNADINFSMNGTGGLTVSNTSSIGGADPMLTLTNTSTVGGVSANPVKILTYKNDSNTTASDLIGEYTVRANGGGATSSTPYDYTSIRSFARGVGANNVDGSLALQVAQDATPTSANLLTYLECNGGNGRVEIKKNIDLTNQDLLNVKQIALGSLTAVGTAGQVITSRGTTAGTTTYSNPNQTAPVGTSVGGQSIDTTTPNFNFVTGAGIAPSFIPVPNNRYRVDFSVSLEGPNQGILVIPRVGYNSVDYFGDIYRDPALGSGANPYVSEPTTSSGLHYHSINFTDYFTIPITASNIISFSVGILSTSGTATVADGAKVGATISPCFD